VAWISPPLGSAPSVKSKLCIVVSVPVVVILKTVPQPPLQAELAPADVVPYKFPSVPWPSGPPGPWSSAQPSDNQHLPVGKQRGRMIHALVIHRASYGP